MKVLTDSFHLFNRRSSLKIGVFLKKTTEQVKKKVEKTKLGSLVRLLSCVGVIVLCLIIGLIVCLGVLVLCSI